MQWEKVLADGKALVAAGPTQQSTEVVRAAVAQLIEAFETSLFNDHETREAAASLVVELARHHPIAVDLVIDGARRYGENQQIEDSFPQTPNSFQVLSRIGGGNHKIISFLRETVESDSGIPRWAAVDALCALRDSEGDRVLQDVVNGKYPPKGSVAEFDIRRRIETARGREFVEACRGTL